MPSKQNPGAFDCYKAALPDEPIFVILGRDPAGPATLDFWASQRIKLGKTVGEDDKDRIRAAIDEAKEMQEWRSRMLEASFDGIPPWRLPVHFIGAAEVEPPTPSREQYVPVEEAAFDAAKRDDRAIRLLATMQAALREVEKAHKGTRDPWIALGEVERILTAGIDAMPTVAADPLVAESIPAKAPVIDTDPTDLAHAPEVPHHRFSVFHKAGDYAYARGLEVNPMHLPVALDAMAKSGWALLAIFGATDSQHIGFIFRREPEPVMIRSPEDQRVVMEYAERLPNGECQITRVPFDDLPEWTHPCYGRGRGQMP